MLAKRLRLLVDRAPVIAQSSVAAAGAWLVANALVGHARPFFAPIAAIVVLSVTQGRHVRRAIELATGVTLGICVADLIVQGLGSSFLTLALVVALAMAAAIVLGGEPLFVSQAAASATLVATLGAAGHFTLARAVDALVGCSVALAVGFLLLPMAPMRATRAAATAVLDALASLLSDLATALERRDRPALVDALERRAEVEARQAAFAEACGVGREIARYAPLRRRDRAPLKRYATAAAMLEYAVDDVAVLGRGALRALDLDDNVPPDVIDALRDLAASVRALAPALDDPQRANRAREHALRAAARATQSLELTANLSTSAIVGQVRSTALDLLRGLGDERDAAAATIRGARPIGTPG
ncbi:MAG: hypothetical protein QOD69_3156 [Solirubrobacteraceae bacterium]|nr:hypothetical protein [Solirubrobacteraceae bacterium]